MAEPIDLDRDVAGQYNTFRVYAYMLKVKRATARNVCNDLSMSSPSLALLHLDKLVKLGLLSKRYGDYFLESSPPGWSPTLLLPDGSMVHTEDITILRILCLYEHGLPHHVSWR